MHSRRKAMIFAAAILFSAPAAAQDSGGVQTETEQRKHHALDYDTIWNVLGLFGLAGAFGLWRPSDNDGYTDDPI
ncbi:MAG: hypothetical protein ABIW03_00190 [Sphingomicrobium sp.]